MKVTKLVHSCLIVEHEGKKVLVDPGNYSWNSGIVNQDSLRDIDYVLVTHAHPDHIDETFASVVNELSPNAIWYVTPATKEKISVLPGVHLETESALSDVRYISSEHADLTHWGACKDHTSFVLFDVMLISGDCHTLTKMHDASIFAVAINGGPWGSVKTCLNMIAAMDVKPMKVIPLHDWHWNDEARKNFYTGLVDAFDKMGIEFVPLQNGASVEL